MNDNLIHDTEALVGVFKKQPDSVIVLGNDLRTIIAHNDAALKLLDKSGKGLEGKDIYQYMAESSRDIALSFFTSIIGGRSVTPISIDLITEEPPLTIDCIACTAMIGGKNVLIVSLGNPDIQQQIRDLKRLKYEAEFYVDLMSHDIRNFNQVTMGYIELLSLSGNLSETEMLYLEKAQKGITGSNKLLDDIKKVRKIRDTADKNLTRMDIGDVLKESIDHAKKAAPGVKLIIRQRFGAEKCFVMANEYIHDIFRHLLENAIKYDPHPEKVVDIEVEGVKRDGRDFWEIRVADRGTGIPDERKRSIFERMTKTTRGAGVGLSIVNIIVAKLGGYIWVEDRVQGDPSQGSVFVVQLPKA